MSNLTANSYTYLQQINPNATTTPTATATATATVTPTPTTVPAGWQERDYTYDANHPHAVASLTSGESTLGLYQYDANGNMTCRIEDGAMYKQVYNAENRVSSIQKIAAGDCASVTKLVTQWDFAYDGDGTRTATLTTPYDASGQPILADTELTVYYFGGAYEVSGVGQVDVEENGFAFASSPTHVRKYYSFAGQTIAVNSCETGDCSLLTADWTLSYLLTDHLGSVVAVTDDQGALITQQRYLPFGGQRTLSGYSTTTLTDYGYTGQRTLDEDMGGLMDYKARFYSSYINHFLQPDSLIPDPANPQAWNRYSYVGNRPINFNDPTGHVECEPGTGCHSPGSVSIGGKKGAQETDIINNAQKEKKEKRKIDEMTCRNGNFAYCSGYQGFQIQLTLLAGMSTNLVNMRGENVSPMLFYGVSLVFDKHGGMQIYGLTRDIKFDPYFTPGVAEKAHSMNYTGAGVTLAGGIIGGTEFAAKGTDAYAGRSIDAGLGIGLISVDHYEFFDEKVGKTDGTKVYGDDIGFSAGTPVSGGSFAVFAHPITSRIGFPIQDPYSE